MDTKLQPTRLILSGIALTLLLLPSCESVVFLGDSVSDSAACGASQ